MCVIRCAIVLHWTARSPGLASFILLRDATVVPRFVPHFAAHKMTSPGGVYLGEVEDGDAKSSGEFPENDGSVFFGSDDGVLFLFIFVLTLGGPRSYLKISNLFFELVMGMRLVVHLEPF